METRRARMRTLNARLRAIASGPTLELAAGEPVERLPYPEGSFDTVVSVLGLARAGDAARTLGELRRVLRPGGRLLFAEQPRVMAGPRHRDTLVLLADAGFTLEMRSRALPGKLRRRQLVVGSARVA